MNRQERALEALRALRAAAANYEDDVNLDAAKELADAVLDDTVELAEVIAEMQRAAPPNRIVVTMEGGLIQEIGADIPNDLEVTVVDFDVEGGSHYMVELPRFDEPDDESVERAHVSTFEVSALTPEETRWIDAKLKRQGRGE